LPRRRAHHVGVDRNLRELRERSHHRSFKCEGAAANKRLLQAAYVRRFCFDAGSSPALFPHGGSGSIISLHAFNAAAEAQGVGQTLNGEPFPILSISSAAWCITNIVVRNSFVEHTSSLVDSHNFAH